VHVADLYGYLFFSSRRRHTRSKRDWSSDVCSSDLDGGRTRRRCRGGRHGRGGAVAVVAGVLRGAGGEGGRDGTGDGECSDCSGEPGHGRGPFALLTPKRIVIILIPPRTHRRPTRWSAVTPPGRAARGYPVRDASVLLDGGLLGREIERDLAIVERRDEARLGGRLVRGGEAELAVRPAVGHVLLEDDAL